MTPSAAAIAPWAGLATSPAASSGEVGVVAVGAATRLIASATGCATGCVVLSRWVRQVVSGADQPDLACLPGGAGRFCRPRKSDICFFMYLGSWWV